MSAIVMRNGDVLRNPWTDSHEDLVTLFKLRDNKVGNFARVEFRPDEPKDLATPAKYKLHVDESVCPDWFTEAKQEKVADKMRGWVKAMIIGGDCDLLCGAFVHILHQLAGAWSKVGGLNGFKLWFKTGKPTT